MLTLVKNTAFFAKLGHYLDSRLHELDTELCSLLDPSIEIIQEDDVCDILISRYTIDYDSDIPNHPDRGLLLITVETVNSNFTFNFLIDKKHNLVDASSVNIPLFYNVFTYYFGTGRFCNSFDIPVSTELFPNIEKIIAFGYELESEIDRLLNSQWQK